MSVEEKTTGRAALHHLRAVLWDTCSCFRRALQWIILGDAMQIYAGYACSCELFAVMYYKTMNHALSTPRLAAPITSECVVLKVCFHSQGTIFRCTFTTIDCFHWLVLRIGFAAWPFKACWKVPAELGSWEKHWRFLEQQAMPQGLMFQLGE